jgi:hypothetical protein
VRTHEGWAAVLRRVVDERFRSHHTILPPGFAVMELSDRVQLLLTNLDKEIKVEVAIERDNGQLGIFHGYR